MLEDSLTKQIDELRLAMENPQSFRKWVREANNPVVERLENSSVRFKGAMPDSLYEKINMLLDAGFILCSYTICDNKQEERTRITEKRLKGE